MPGNRPRSLLSANRYRLRAAGSLLVAAVLQACGGGGGSDAPATPPAAQNIAPTVATIADQTIDEGTLVTLDVSANDIDGAIAAFDAQGVPGFATIDDLGNGMWRVNVAPGFDDSGAYPITVVVTDDEGATGQAGFMLTVADVNRPPALSNPGVVSIAEGVPALVRLTAVDPDGDPMTIGTMGLPAFASIMDHGDGTADLQFTAGFQDSGDYLISVVAMDSGGFGDRLDLTVTVNDTNRSPTIAALADIEMDENSIAAVQVVATDPDGDAIGLQAIALPSFASFSDNGDGTAGILLQPDFFDGGSYSVTVRAADPDASQDEATFAVNVSNVNRPPTLSAIVDQTLNEDETVMLSLDASDPDEETLSFAVDALPGFVTLTDNGDGSGQLDVHPGFDDAGTHTLSVSVADTNGGTDEFQFSIVVDNVNRSPVLSDIGSFPIPEGSTWSWPFDANDPDSDPISFEASGLPPFVTLIDYGNNSGVLMLEPGVLDSGEYSVIVRAVDTGTPSLSDERSVNIVVNLTGANHVAHENALPGTADWHLDNPALLREIEGYASATSVNGGDIISLFVNTNAPSFTLEVFRTGWYQGLGARRLLDPVDIPGTSQITPAPDPTTGFVEANWVNPFELQTSDSISGDPWPTGVYLARLTESVGGMQSYIIFVVRDDGNHHDMLFQLPVTTYQAYNAWGGKSIYGFNSGIAEPWGSTPGARATHISFDRPYARNPYDPAAYGMGAGEYLTNVQPVGRIDGAGWDYNMVRWLEHEQYDVGYITNIDTHRNLYSPSDTFAFISQGHDEYWTWEMRTHVDMLRDQGTNLAFFASNAAYYQMRFEPSPTTAATDRVMVVYKDEALDPVFTDANPLNDFLTTIPFRNLPVPQPEEALIGVQYVLDPVDTDIIVTNPTHWVFSKTGLTAGATLDGLLGYEPDGIFGGGPANLEVLAETPIVSSQDPGNTGTSHMTIYQPTPLSYVFATGSLQWSWGLDDYNAPALRTSRTSAAAQQISANVLESFGALPHPGDESLVASCVRIRSLSDVTDDETFAVAEFDLLDSDGRSIPKTGWTVLDFDSEETVGWDHRADYAIDGDPMTFWQTSWAAGATHPHFMDIDLGGFVDVSALRYVPRQDSSLDGTPGDYEVYTSEDCASWTLVASGSWDTSHGRKLARFEQL